MAKKYRYFISYVANTDKGPAHGWFDVTLDNKIRTGNDLVSAIDWLVEKTEGMKEASVVAWIPFEKTRWWEK